MKKLCILDIETTSLSIEEAEVKFIGILDLQTNEYQIINYKNQNINNILKEYNFIITFNGIEYDSPILKKYKIIVPDYKHIDLYKVYKKKAPLLRSGGFKSYSLNNISKEIGSENKGEIDYEIFQKKEWTQEEEQEINKYLTQDLNLTKHLWDYLIEKFDSLKEYISKEDAKKFKHITMSSGAYGYKVICHLLGLREEYDDSNAHTSYEGGYVMQPKEETIRGNILYFDFASLYPMMYVHNNLFSPDCDCCTKEEKWHGNENFKIEGYYCSKEQGKIEELIKDFYMKRKTYKENKDNRQFAIKIFLNSLYGISAKPSFKQIYNKHTASDCTALARQCIHFAINKFEEKGYEVIYGDTDSVIVKLKEDQIAEPCKQLAKNISTEISSQFPFPFEEFNLKLDDELKYLQFFKGRDGQLNKKHYLYVSKDNKLTIKGLDIIRKDCSNLSLKIFNEIKEDIIKNLDCKFEEKLIVNRINSILKEDKNIIAKRFNIRPLKNYKSKTSIYYLIGEKYGSGEIFLIKNYKLGAGKGIKYCSVEEAKELEIEDLNLEDVYKELGVFIKDYKGIVIKKRKQIQQGKQSRQMIL